MSDCRGPYFTRYPFGRWSSYLYEDETGDEDVSNIIWDGDPTTLNFGLALASWILGLPDVDDKKAQAIIDILWRFYR